LSTSALVGEEDMMNINMKIESFMHYAYVENQCVPKDLNSLKALKQVVEVLQAMKYLILSLAIVSSVCSKFIDNQNKVFGKNAIQRAMVCFT
jgi:hypothetical protein